MSTVLLTTGEALRDTFRAWHADQDSVDAQLRDSLEALSAYQSHLDQWQQQLARDRTELQTAQQQFHAERVAAQAMRGDVDVELAQLQSVKEEIQRERDVLQASRDALEIDQAKAEAQLAELNRRDEEILAKQHELDRCDDEIRARQAKLDKDTEDLESLRMTLVYSREETDSAGEQLEHERAELRTANEKREIERAELRDRQLRLDRERDELESARRQLEHDRDTLRTKDSTTEAAHQAELHAAREKIGSLTDSLLSRTEELRTLDIRRAEAVAELELVRAHETELKSALEEHKRTAELDRLNWTAEVRQLHDLLQRRPEPVMVESRESADVPEPVVASAARPAATNSQPTGNKVAPAADVARGNPVLGSIVQQFDKLRQQRATDRHTGHKPR